MMKDVGPFEIREKYNIRVGVWYRPVRFLFFEYLIAYVVPAYIALIFLQVEFLEDHVEFWCFLDLLLVVLPACGIMVVLWKRYQRDRTMWYRFVLSKASDAIPRLENALIRSRKPNEVLSVSDRLPRFPYSCAEVFELQNGDLKIMVMASLFPMCRVLVGPALESNSKELAELRALVDEAFTGPAEKL
jgi:hypothetical protein